MAKPGRKALLTMSALSCFLAWLAWLDQNNIDRDVARLKQIIRETNQKSWRSKDIYELSFKNRKALVLNRDTGKVEGRLRVPTLHEVNYETIEGKGKIIFDGYGTDSRNVLLHGGEIILRSWSGEERTLWIHCTGYVTEGKMTDRTAK